MKKTTKVKENAPGAWKIPPLQPTDNKYTRGHLVILGGEVMTGAAKLSALAAQRAGAGLVTIAATPKSWPIYASSTLSIIAKPCTSKDWKTLMADARVKAILLGPGSGVNARTKNALLSAAESGKTLVLDADALTILASDATLRRAMMDAPKILTPHEGEYTRLAKAIKSSATLDKPALATRLAKAYGAVVVLKGAETIIADAQGKLRATHPPAWLATAGTGDVLSGIIAALVAQGMKLFDAAAAGVWLHAQAAREHGAGMIAEDLIASVPKIVRKLTTK